MNEQPSPEFEKELRETLGAPQANPAFVRDLRATLIERSTMNSKNRVFPRLAWGFALAMLLALWVVAAPRAAATLKKLLGYMPGVGFVQSDEALRVLAEPVTLQQAGLQVTLENGTVDAQHTLLFLRVTGAIAPDPTGARFCDTPAQLVLPDGTVFKQSGYSFSVAEGGTYVGRYEFEVLPADQLTATLVVPCLFSDSSLADFNFDLRFKPADASAVQPVITLPTSSATLPTPPETASVSTADIQGFAIVLTSEAPLEDGYILTGHYEWTDPRFDNTSVYPFNPQLTDALGQSVQFEGVDPGATSVEVAPKSIPFAFHILGKRQAFPLTLSLESVTVNLPDAATFQFDAGANPQVGQTWDVKYDVPIAGHVIHVQRIQLTSGRTPSELGFTFIMTADADVMGVAVSDADPRLPNLSSGGGGGGGGEASGPMQYGWALDGYVPAGVKTFVVSDVAVVMAGPWQVTWEPTTP